MISVKPTVETSNHVSFRGDGAIITLTFASEEGKQAFLRNRWPQLRVELEVAMEKQSDNHPELRFS